MNYLLVLLLGAMLVSCASAPQAPRDIVVGLVGEPSSLLGDGASAHFIWTATSETLVRRDAKDQFVARLAIDVPTIENGGLRIVSDDPTAPEGRQVATFRLRQGLTWHDGEPITAFDVLFAWNEDRVAPQGSSARYAAERVEAMEVLSDRVVRVVYKAGERWENYALAPRVMPRHLLEGATAEARAAYGRAPVHAGPFTVTDWISGVGLTLVAFDDYALGPPAARRIVVRFLRDREAAIDALGRGAIDVAPSPVLESDLATVLDRMADGTERSRLLAYYTPAESLEVLRFGERFRDPVLRRAFELAIDRQELVETVFAGRARIPKSYLVPPLWAAVDDGVVPQAHQATARALFADAGFQPGNVGILEREGDRLVLTLLVTAGSEARLELANLMVRQLARVGVGAEIRELNPDDLEVLIASGSYDLAVGPVDASDAQAATSRWAARAGPWFVVLADAARSAPALSDRLTLYAELQRIWTEEVVAVPLYQHLTVDVARRDLIGILPTPHGAPLTWNVAEWHFGTQ